MIRRPPSSTLLPNTTLCRSVSDTPDTVMREMETSQLKEAIERLPDRARYVLVRRYGLDDQEPATLAELGDELDISRERDRKSTRLNSSHANISYAVFCLKKN